MRKARVITDAVVLTLGLLCFITGFAIELLNFNVQSCWLIAAVLFALAYIFVPRSLARVNKRKNSIAINISICFSAIILLSILVVMMANLIYFAIWGFKFWEGYQGFIYPAILTLCLLESYIDYIIHERYKHPDSNEEFE